jgi:hypothetical protein
MGTKKKKAYRMTRFCVFVCAYLCVFVRVFVFVRVCVCARASTTLEAVERL